MATEDYVIDASQYGAHPGKGAGPNTAAIQRALNEAAIAGGTVSIRNPGTYNINNRLLIYSDTRLILSPGVTLKQFKNTNLGLLYSAQMEQTFAACTLAWTSGLTMTITQANHGVTGRNDYYVVKGADQDVFNDCFPVEVVSGDVITVRLAELPSTTPTGTTLGLKAGNEIYIEGGTWDYNYAENDSGTNAGYRRHIMTLGYVGRVTLRNIRFKNQYKFGVNLGANCDISIEDLLGDDNEFVKVYGPVRNIRADRVMGSNREDGMTIHPREEDDFSAYRWTFGSIRNIEYTNINIACRGPVANGPIAIFPSASHKVEGIRISSSMLHNHIGAAFLIWQYAGAGGSYNVKSCTIEKTMLCGAKLAGGCINVDNAHVGSLVIRQCDLKQFVNATQILIYIEPDASVDTLLLEDIVFTDTTYPSNSTYFIQIGGTVKNLIFRRCTIRLHATNGRFLQIMSTATVPNTVFENCDMEAFAHVVFVAAGGTTKRKISFIGGRYKTMSNVTDIRMAGTVVHTEGVTYDRFTNSVHRGNITSGAMELHSGGGNVLNSCIAGSSSGSSTMDVRALDLAILPSATGMTETDGNMALRAVAQVATGEITAVDGTPANNTFTVALEGSTTTISVTGTTDVATTAAALATALNASSDAYFAAITWNVPGTGQIRGTADTAGMPFTATLSKSGAGAGTVTDFVVGTRYHGACMHADGTTYNDIS